MPIQYQNRNTNNYNSDSGIGTVIGLAVVGIGLYVAFQVVVFLGLSIFTSVVSLTFPAFINCFLSFSSPSIDLNSCLLLVTEGVLSGVFIGCIRKFLFFKSEFGKSFFSELFSFEILKSDPTFLSTIILNLFVGLIIGFISGAGGAHGILQVIFTSDIINVHSPIGILISGGGAGGIGSDGGILFFIFIVLVFLIQGIAVGITSGLSLSILFGAIGGAIKGGTLEPVFSLITNNDNNQGKKRIILHSMKKGLLEGAVIGGIVGLIQGIVVAIQAVNTKK